MPLIASIAILVIYFIFLPLVFIACIAWIVHQKKISRQLYSFGVEVTADIIKHDTHQLPRGQAHYITYRFIVPGNENAVYIQEQEVGLRHYRSFALGSSVKVIYLPNNPTVSKLSGADTDNVVNYRMTLNATIFGAIWLTILFIAVRIM